MSSMWLFCLEVDSNKLIEERYDETIRNQDTAYLIINESLFINQIFIYFKGVVIALLL